MSSRSRLMPSRAGWLAAAASLTLLGVSSAAAVVGPSGGVDPATVELTLRPGEEATVIKRVTPPAVAPTPDIVFLADTTAGMDPAVANFRNNVSSIIAGVRESQPDARFGVAGYKERDDGSNVFRVFTHLTADDDLVRAGAAGMTDDVGGGGVSSTDFINAHHRIATDAFAFRRQSTPIIVWFGDARSHDPSLGHTLADTNAALQAAGLRVVAVPVSGTPGGGLDSLGQATSITAATDGKLMPASDPDELAQALLEGIRGLWLTVTPRVTSCDSALTVRFDFASRRVPSGIETTFNESFHVNDVPPGTYHCSVEFLVNGMSGGLVQSITLTVPGEGPNRPPVAADDSYSVAGGQELTVPAPGVLGNDSDPDGDPLVAAIDSGPSHGTLTLSGDGSFAYSPSPGFSGNDSFAYTASDDHAQSPVATVTIQVLETTPPETTIDSGPSAASLAESWLREVVQRAVGLRLRLRSERASEEAGVNPARSSPL